jgi:hypothetical protein
MKRALVLAAVWAGIAALPATAEAGAWKGVVISKDAKRHAVVTATRGGTVKTLRAPKLFNRLGVGRLVTGRVATLPDGTLVASGLRQRGPAKRVRVAAVVVRRASGRLILSAGKSVFSIRVSSGGRAAATSGGGGLAPGDRVVLDGDVGKDGVETKPGDVKEVGHAGRLELEGIFLATKDGVLDLAVVHKGLVHVTIPDSMEAPDFAPGDEIVLVVSVDSDGNFTLVKAENESRKEGGDSVDIDTGKSEFAVLGVLTARSDAMVAVRVAGVGKLVRCAVPDGMDVSKVDVGQMVKMYCRFSDGRFVLVKLRSGNGETGAGGDKVEVAGKIVELSGSKVAVQAEDRQPLRCSIRKGSDLSAFAVGDWVKIRCWVRDGTFLLKDMKSSWAVLTEDGKTELWVKGTLVELSDTAAAVRADGRADPFRCARPKAALAMPGTPAPALVVGALVKMSCRSDGGQLVVTELYPKDEPTDPSKGEATLNGVIVELTASSVGIHVEGKTEAYRCFVPPTVNLSGFAFGEVVELHCHYIDGRWVLASLKSSHAEIAEEGQTWFTVEGVLAEVRSALVAVTVEHHPEPVRCGVAPGADLSAFAVGQVVELHCHFHDGAFWLATLKSSSASIELEP